MELLLTTKFHMPTTRGVSVSRPRLNCKLLPVAPVSLICAPAGFGKTTLASEWLGLQECRTAWLSLDENDSDIQRFFLYFFSALERTLPGIAQQALELLDGASQENITTAITRLINDVEMCTEPLILALDDYHLIVNDEIHAALSFLINHQPRHFHLLLISRSTPSLPLTKLRAKNRLNELRTADLRFNSDETASFLNHCMELGLTPVQIARLEKHSEGWITGLQLAALTLRDIDETDSFIDNLSGEDRHIIDYLISEVLAHQDQGIQDFLIQTSILNRMNADLCDSLLQTSGSQGILEQLEQNNLFIVALDNNRRWYRYHHLFSQMLQSRLSQQEAVLLHSRATLWFMSHGMWEDAIVHALEAKDYDQVIKHLESNIDQILAGGRFSIYLQWFNRVPADYLPPVLTLHQLFFLHEMGEFDAYDRCLRHVERQLADKPLEQMLVERGILSVIKGICCASVFDVKDARQHLKQALKQLPAEQLFWRILALSGLGFCLRVEGDYKRSIQVFMYVAEMAARENLLFCYYMDAIAAAKLYLEYGQLDQAKHICHSLIDYNKTATGEIPFTGLVHVVLGQSYYQSGDMSLAEQHLNLGISKIHGDGDLFSIIDAYMALAQCLLDQKRVELSIAAMDDMSRIVTSLDPSEAASIIVRSYRTLISTASGRIDVTDLTFSHSEGQYLVVKKFPDLYPLKYQGIYRTGQQSLTFYSNMIHLIRAKLALAQKKVQSALEMLIELVERFDSSSSHLFKAEVYIQLALTYDRLGHNEMAVSSLGDAIALLAPEQYSQIFIREGDDLYQLLECVRKRNYSGSPETQLFIDHILMDISRHQNSVKTHGLSFDLTPRELEVLEALARGASYQATADQLYVSVNTLKTHIKRAYSKLGVSNRTQAINKVKKLDMLSPIKS